MLYLFIFALSNQNSENMKRRILILVFIILSSIAVTSCKKKKEAEPTTPAPTTTNITVELSLVEFTDYAGTITAPNLIATSASGDTISAQAMNVTDTVANSTSITDACIVPLSCTVTHPLLQDGSVYTVYLREGTTTKSVINVSYSSVTSVSGLGYTNMCGSNYHKVVVGW